MPRASPAPARVAAGGGETRAASALRLLPTACWGGSVGARNGCLGAGCCCRCCMTRGAAVQPFCGLLAAICFGIQTAGPVGCALAGRGRSPGMGSRMEPAQGNGREQGKGPRCRGSGAIRPGRAAAVAVAATGAAAAVTPEGLKPSALAAAAGAAAKLAGWVPFAPFSAGGMRDAAAPASTASAAEVGAGDGCTGPAGSAAPGLACRCACCGGSRGAPAPEGPRCVGAGAGTAARMVAKQ